MIKYYTIGFNTIRIIMKCFIYQQSHLSSKIGKGFLRILDQVLYLGLAVCFKTKVKCTMKVRTKLVFQKLNLYLTIKKNQDNRDQAPYLKPSLFKHP